MSDMTQPRPIGDPQKVRPANNKRTGGLMMPAEVLFIGSLDSKQIKLDDKAYHLTHIEDPGQAMEMLPKQRFHLFILDDDAMSHSTRESVLCR